MEDCRVAISQLAVNSWQRNSNHVNWILKYDFYSGV